MGGAVHREGSIYVHVKECIAVCDIQVDKERKCISAHPEWYGIVRNCWKIWYISPTTFYVIYYSQNNVLPNIIFTIRSFVQMQYYLKTPSVNKLTQITSETDVWLGPTENSPHPPILSGDLWWDSEKSLEIINPAQFDIHRPRWFGSILFLCKFPSSLHVCQILSWQI